MADTPIPIADLPTVIPGEYDYVVVAQLGNARKALAPEVTAAAAALSVGLDGLLATKGAEFDADAAVVLTGLGYLPPVLYAAGISLTSTHQTVEYNGAIYAPLAAQLPFTTSGTFETAKFRLIQGQGSSMSGMITYTGGDGIFLKVDGDAFDARCQSRDFNFGFREYPVINGVGVRGNTVANFGWNVANDTTREDPTEAMACLSFEEHFIDGFGNPGFEFHLQGMYTSGAQWRAMSFFMPKNGAAVGCEFDLGNLNLGNSAGALKWQFNLDAGTVGVFGGGTIDFQVNGGAVIRQKNSFGVLAPLPYYDSVNALIFGGPTRCSGLTPTTGTYPNSFAVIQASGLPVGGIAQDVLVNPVAGSALGARWRGAVVGDWTARVHNESTDAAANAVLEAFVHASSSGDPKVRFTINGVTGWDMGVDNSDSDTFKWSRGTALGTNDMASLSTAGHFAVAGTIKTAVKTVATLGAAATVGASARSYVTDATVTTFGSIVVGGGTNTVPVYCDGTNWKIG